MKNEEVSACQPDLSREYKTLFSWCPSRSLIACIRAYERYSNSRNPICILARNIAVFRHRFWSVVAGADIPINSNIEGGLMTPHPNGVVIHPGVQIGPNCLIFQQVTIGTRNGTGVPQIGGHVDIGAGAKILGAIRIGDHARIGANSVVLQDVPERATAVGIPAVIVSK